MKKYHCQCPQDSKGRLKDDEGYHDDRCPAGQLQDWANNVLRYFNETWDDDDSGTRDL